MKKLLAIFLISVQCLVVFKPFSPYVEYLINYDYIVNVLCINKDKPELKCNGSCHLNTEIKKSMEQQQDNPLQSTPNNQVSKLNVFLISSLEELSCRNLNLQEKPVFIYDNASNYHFYGKITTPPPQYSVIPA
ncbi:MAG: hypothetical protein OEW75_11630 [Cyclobacteriaceae bacterium]|nr:hypothetical protein [Cyclobacteriaceae bacterium]